MLIIDELRKDDRPLRAVALAVLAGLGLLLAGLLFVQVLSAKRYRTSQIKQSFRTLRVPAVRGRILDVNSTPLADNRPSYNLSLYLEELRPLFQAAYSNEVRGQKLSRSQRTELGRLIRYQTVSNLLAQLGRQLGQPLPLSLQRFDQHYHQRLFLPMPVATGLTLEQVARYVEQAADLPGVDLEVQPTRAYPHQSLAAHFLGYVQRDEAQTEEEALLRILPMPVFRGANGLEAAFDEALRGRSGVKSVLVNSLGFRETENVWTAAEPGRTVHLTIDLAIQKAAEDALRAAKVPGGGPTRGAVVVMDPRNGDVLALASSPSFDPNVFGRRMTQEEWDRLNDEKQRPLLNRATAGIYPPGSVFKIIVGLAGLEAGTLRPQAHYASKGYYELGQRRIGDTAGPGDFDFRRALIRSSNPYFIHEGLQVGPDRILELGQRLHLGEPAGIPAGQDSAGTLPTRDWQREHLGGAWRDGNTANLCIGQGEIAVTPLQVAVLISAIANGGRVYWPRLVTQVEPADPTSGARPVMFPPGRLRDDLRVSPSNLDLVRRAMHDDVADAEGTGTAAAVAGMDICAKTGTAQVTRGRRVVGHTTWFASFAPLRDPHYVVVVMVEDGASGSLTCAPVAKPIYQAIQKLESTNRVRMLARGP
jgi:penicillin-binding protein 2